MDESRLEKKIHGTEGFPFQIYPMRGSTDGDVVPYHWHPELEIIRVMAGEVGLTIADKQYIGRTNDLFFVASAELHEIRSGRGGQFRSFVFPADFLQFRRADQAQTDLLSPLEAGSLWFPTELRADEAGNPALIALLNGILEACANPLSGYELKVKALLLLLLSEAMQSGLLQTMDRTPRDYKTQLLREIVAYLDKNCTEPLRLSEVAQHFGMSPQYFCTFFKSHLGRSFVQHVNFLRIERASRLLRETDQPIMDIGFSVGFENFSYFIKRFRTVFGCTPSAYRRGDATGGEDACGAPAEA